MSIGLLSIESFSLWLSRSKFKGQIKYLSLNNEPCQPRPTLIDLNPDN